MSDSGARIERLITERKLMPGGRNLYAAGRPLHMTQNCALYSAQDSREGWADLLRKSSMALMTGAGIGISYDQVRPSGSAIKKTGGLASGPISLMQIVNEAGRHIMQGGARRSAIWAGLPWDHADVEEFIRIKDWDDETVERKARDTNATAPLDMTNISVQLDDAFFRAYDRGDEKARRVYGLAVSHMLRTAEPGFSVDVGRHKGEVLRNACCEISSRDDSDICNLGSINLARISDIAEMREAVMYGTLFLLANTLYSDVPHEEVAHTRAKNRRLGLGLMGVHEWLLQRGKPYGPDEELEGWLREYERSTEYAATWARQYGISAPIATRAIAPTGTIAIVAETTWGMEPILAKAYKRRYKEAVPGAAGDITRFQYVVDPAAKRLVDSGVDPDTIEDAYSLSFDRRLTMQSWLQGFVDQAVSSTINLPHPIVDPAEVEYHGEVLYQHLPNLRGVTCYPNGARGGQPITPVPYELAIEQQGVEFTEQEDRCRGATCST
jgi:ribonucleoside-diphosphate reductase alpha chain